MSKQVQVTFHQGVHSCDLRFTRDYVRKSLLICLLILDLSSSSSDLQLMCEGLRDKSLSSVKVLKDVYTYCDLSKQFTDPSLKRWNFCDWYKLDTKVAMTIYWTSMRQERWQSRWRWLWKARWKSQVAVRTSYVASLLFRHAMACLFVQKLARGNTCYKKSPYGKTYSLTDCRLRSNSYSRELMKRKMIAWPHNTRLSVLLSAFDKFLDHN